MSLRCSNCQRDAPEGARFCADCGSAVVRACHGSEPADPLIGKTLKRTYLVEEVIGVGGMGKVYKATHLALDVKVALKVLKRELLHNAALVQRFHREAKAASRLRHANVIGVTDFGQTEDGTLFIAMELVHGRGLGKIIAEEAPFPEARAVRIGTQILAALVEAHSAGVLHRDLKPENVMVEPRRDEPDSVKVIDFGIAKIQAPEKGESSLTQAGMVWGTPSYMSPEQWSQENLDARSDLYSVGVILYEMLAGQKPHKADTPLATIKRLQAQRPIPPHQCRPGITVSAPLEALVLRALSFHRADRPASAAEMKAALCACRPAGRPPPIPVETAEQRAPETKGLPALVAGVVEDAERAPASPTAPRIAPGTARRTAPRTALPLPSVKGASRLLGALSRRRWPTAAAAAAGVVVGLAVWLSQRSSTGGAARVPASLPETTAAALPPASLAADPEAMKSSGQGSRGLRPVGPSAEAMSGRAGGMAARPAPSIEGVRAKVAIRAQAVTLAPAQLRPEKAMPERERALVRLGSPSSTPVPEGVDAALVAARDEALRAEGRGVLSPTDAANAWERVAGAGGWNPFKADAQARAAQWRARAKDESLHLSMLMPLSSVPVEQKLQLLLAYCPNHSEEDYLKLLRAVPKDERAKLEAPLFDLCVRSKLIGVWRGNTSVSEMWIGRDAQVTLIYRGDTLTSRFRSTKSGRGIEFSAQMPAGEWCAFEVNLARSDEIEGTSYCFDSARDDVWLLQRDLSEGRARR